MLYFLVVVLIVVGVLTTNSCPKLWSAWSRDKGPENWS